MSIDTNDPNKEQHVIADYANELKELEMQGYETAVRKARNALFWTGGLLFLGEMINMFRVYEKVEPLVVGIALVEAGLFVALGLWTKKKPFTAIVTGLILFIAIITLSAVIAGKEEGSEGVLKALFGGIVVKVIILVVLIKGLSDAKALEKAKQERF